MSNFTKLATLLFLLATSTSLMATDYTVSGAGSSAANGTYVETGTYNGKPQYLLGTTNYYLKYNDMGIERWEIIGNDPEWGPTTYYYTNDAGDNPPSTGWQSYSGTDPAPSVTPASAEINYSSDIFNESSADDGTIDNSTPCVITHNNFNGETFTGNNNDDFVTDGKVIVTNLPTGLTVVVTRTGPTTLSVTITGSANSHNNANDVANLTFAFQNSAFSSNNASATDNSTKSDLSINFMQEYNVASSGGDFTTITAAINAAGDNDVINISAETYTEAGISINKNLTLQGEGAASTIVQAHVTEGLATDRVFNIEYGATATIKNMTIRHGKTRSGGGISCDGTLSLVNATVCNNQLWSNVSGQHVYGGAIYGKNITITGCTISNNSSTLTSDRTHGSAIYNNGIINITNSTITNNVGARAIELNGEMSFNNCTITNNNDGGITINWKKLTIRNTIIANNGSSDYHVAYGVTLIDNGNNIVENQTYSGTPSNWYFNQPTDILFSHDYLGNTQGAWNRNDGSVSGSLNISSTLADNSTLNGTQTLALSSGSFAIDAGTNTDAPTTDQRGMERNGTTDIGAYEFEGTPSPVELTNFTATLSSEKVVLNWQTATEVNNYGFEIQRSVGQISNLPPTWENIAFVEGHGNSNSPKEYSFFDADNLGGVVKYRLKQIDINGAFEYSNIVTVDMQAPTTFKLAQNYPNPFNPTTVIGYDLPNASDVTLKIYDVLGREIITLVKEHQNAGKYEAQFNASSLTSGIYFYSLQTENFTAVKKLTLLK